MEIHNNNISRVEKEKLSIQKKSTVKPVENKKAEADSLNALASYGMAQVNSCSFRGNNVKSPIEVPREKRLNIINLLGIKDKREIKKLLNFTGFQFAVISPYLYLGYNTDYIESDGSIEEIDENNEDYEELYNYINKSQKYLIDNPQVVIDFVKYLSEQDVSTENKSDIAEILIALNDESISFTKELLEDKSKNLSISQISSVLLGYTPQTENFIRNILNKPEEEFSADEKILILRSINPDNIEIAEQLISDPKSKYSPLQINSILFGTQKETVSFVKQVLSDENLEYTPEDLSRIIRTFRKDNLNIARELLYNTKSGYTVDDIINILSCVTEENNSFAMDLICDTSENRFEGKDIGIILVHARRKTLDFVQNFITQNNNYSKEDKVKIITNYALNDKTTGLVQRLINQKSEKRVSADTITSLLNTLGYDDLKIDFANYLTDLYEKDEIDLDEHIPIIQKVKKDNVDLIKQLINLPKEKRISANSIYRITDNVFDYPNYNWDKNEGPKINKLKLEFAYYLIDMHKKDKIDLEKYIDLISNVNERNFEFIKNIIDNQQENGYSASDINQIVSAVNTLLKNTWTSEENIDKISFSTLIAKNELGYNTYEVCSIIRRTNAEQALIIKDIVENYNDLFTNEDKKIIINKCLSYGEDFDKISELNRLIDLIKQGKLSRGGLFAVLYEENNFSLKDIRELELIMGKDAVNSLSEQDLIFAAQFKDICNKQNINEIPIYKKKDVLRRLVANNAGLFNISENLSKYFPLLPRNQEEYCTLLPALVRSLGIETNTLSDEEVKTFYTSIFSLAEALKGLSDEEFISLDITQEYPKSEFIKDTFSIVRDLTPQERQKVYDYFGFELHYNENGVQVDDNQNNKFSITGYPVNLNNGKKLAQITDPKTKEIIEQLREKVIKFSQDNKINCNNPKIEELLNNIVGTFPELRTQIDRIQHGAHKYDIMKHSLKVMQKIVQNPDYEKLSESDKRIMLICAMLHDGNKTEGMIDKFHAEESAFDAYYIINKLDLSSEEKIKIYSLIKHHEWLGYVNSKKYKGSPEKRQQSAAFDLQYDNLFDMAKIFTIADLKSVKTTDEFYWRYKDDFETHSKAIESYIKELKKSQPLLPVTKIPKASTIAKAITTVNDDGSTNIKGIYKNKDGLIIIKFNEVENGTWEKIGFPKGSVSSGIEAKGHVTVNGDIKLMDDVNTGNIKFFVHGLDFSNQLAKFDAFALPDSEALLSVSYTERPESKYRFFRSQGILLDVDTKYIHGGGNTDSGSGFGKSIDDFKSRYIFGGEREKDRNYISDLIKKALDLTDEEYVEFVRQNADKPFTQIEPKETAEKIVKALAAINSNTRIGNRNYNEMYISNPRVMGVFAYSQADNVGNIMQFIDSQADFLKQYALEKDLPFIVFGD